MALSCLVIISKLQSWKGPYGSSSPAPIKKAQWGFEPPTSSSTARGLNHFCFQRKKENICADVFHLCLFHIPSSFLSAFSLKDWGSAFNILPFSCWNWLSSIRSFWFLFLFWCLGIGLSTTDQEMKPVPEKGSHVRPDSTDEAECWLPTCCHSWLPQLGFRLPQSCWRPQPTIKDHETIFTFPPPQITPLWRWELIHPTCNHWLNWSSPVNRKVWSSYQFTQGPRSSWDLSRLWLTVKL